jgi:hypothetical protein
VTTFGKKRGDRQSSAFVKLDIAPSVEWKYNIARRLYHMANDTTSTTRFVTIWSHITPPICFHFQPPHKRDCLFRLRDFTGQPFVHGRLSIARDNQRHDSHLAFLSTVAAYMFLEFVNVHQTKTDDSGGGWCCARERNKRQNAMISYFKIHVPKQSSPWQN